MIDDLRPQIQTALTAVPPGRAVIERDNQILDAFDSHFVDCYNFKQYVADKNDIDGMVAYCFYKFQKIDYIQKNLHLPEEHLLKACESFVKGRNFLEHKERARNKIADLERATIAAFARQKTKRDLIIGICAGLVASLFAPLFYSGLDYLITSSGVIHSFNQKQIEQSVVAPGQVLYELGLVFKHDEAGKTHSFH